ncbi:Crp/Fnr family transcriptional regulator [bacterium]|nr:Crp/Fnr family transcriptional regulator [bacterium]
MKNLQQRADVSKELEKCRLELNALHREIHDIHSVLINDDEASQNELAQSHFSSIENSNKLYAITVPQIVPPGTELFLQGSIATEVYFIEKGMVKLIYQESSGKEVIAAFRFSGWSLASSSAILNETLPLTAVTLSRCHLRIIPAEDFRCLVKNNVDLSWHIQQMSAREISSQVSHLTGIECLSAKQRLEELIWQFISAVDSEEPDKPVRLQFPAKHSEIAQFLAVTPQYVSWLIGQLEREKILKRDKGWLIIHQPKKLWHRTELYESSLPMDSGFAACFNYTKDVLRLVE